MATYYLELSEEEASGTSHKFYEVIVEGLSVTIKYGRIGTDGRIGSDSAASRITSCQPTKVNIASPGAKRRVWQVRCTTW